ncbi:hypothetical protein P5V15_011591 [Pogonomyrmex californicus]
MNFAIERLHEKDNTRIIFEHDRSYTCGRGKENDILCLSLLVSRRHCIFFCDANANLYVTDLRSSNGIFVNGEAKSSHQMIKLYENDIIGIGCPNIDPSNETLYNYKICLIKSPIEDEEPTLSKTILNNNTLQRTSVSPENRVLGNKCASTSDHDSILPNKKAKVSCSNEHGSNINLSKRNSDLSCNNQSLCKSVNTSNNVNNLVKVKCDTSDVSEDDIEIIHTSLAKEVKKENTCNLQSAECSNKNKRSDFEEKTFDICSTNTDSNDDNTSDRDKSKNNIRKKSDSIDKQNDALNFTESSNFVHTKDGRIIKYEDELQITDDDEEAHMLAAVECEKTHDETPIKLKRIKHERKTRFSVIDVVDLSDDEEGVFPYSQLFDIKYDDNTEIKTEIEQECVNDDDQNIEKMGLLNMDDEVIILTDSEDESNPWLERLSRSQLLNENIQSTLCDTIVKNEIDLEIWDEVSNIARPGVSHISQVSDDKTTFSESHILIDTTSIDDEIKNEKDDRGNDLSMTKTVSMDIDEIDLSKECTLKDIDKSKWKAGSRQDITQAVSVNERLIDEVVPFKKSTSRDIDNKSKQKTGTRQDIAQTVPMDVDKVVPSKKFTSKDIDKSKQKTDAKQGIAQAIPMDVDKVVSSKKSTSRDIDDKSKRKIDIRQDIVQAVPMDVDKVSSSKKFTSKDIDKSKRRTDAKQIIAQAVPMDVDKIVPSKKSTSRDIDDKSKRKIDARQGIIQAVSMDLDEVEHSKEFISEDIDRSKRKTDARQSITQAVSMDVDEVIPSKKFTSRDIDDKSKRKTEARQDIVQTASMNVDEIIPSKKSISRDIDDKNKRKTEARQDIAQKLNEQTPSLESVREKITKKSTAKRLIPVIEAPNLPVRRRSRIDHNKDKATEVRDTSRSRLTEQENKMSNLKDKLNDAFYSKERKRHKKRSKSYDRHSLSETKFGSSISKDEKKIIIEKRKEKLKEIAAEKKMLSAADSSNVKQDRRIAKPRAKMSLKNRGDFLVPEEEPETSKSLPEAKSAEVPKSNPNRSNKQSTDNADVTKSTTSKRHTHKSHEKTHISKDTVSNIVTSLQQSLHLNNMDTIQAPTKNTLDLKASDDNKKKYSSSKSSMKKRIENSDPIAKSSSDLHSIERTPSHCETSRENFLIVQKENRSPGSLKSILEKREKSRAESKKKKKVSFLDKIDVREYEIDQNNNFKKLTWKDAPIPTNKLAKAPAATPHVESTPKLEEFLLRIFKWKPVWLEEQRYLKNVDPPIVDEDELQPMKLSYDSYKQYYEVAMPLLLLEIWYTMTKDLDTVQKKSRRCTMMCSVVQNSITRTPIPSTELFLTTLMLEVLITEEQYKQEIHPIFGDLVYLEYVIQENGKFKCHRIFAYVTNSHTMIITNFTHYNRDLRNYVKNPYAVITYTLLTRPLEHDILVNRIHRVRAVTYLRASIRMVQALQYLPQSPLLELIVSPKIQSYQLQSSNEQYTSSSLVTKENLNLKQLEAVFKVTNTVLNKEAKLCFIQGPPGTGKSKVIVNLVTQILYGEQRDNNKSLKILVCAPSNAAIDEIVLRLLNVRSILKQKNRFNMVRIGRSESMHPTARNISVSELAKRHLERFVRREKEAFLNGGADPAVLRSHINSYQNELKNIQEENEEKKKELTNKLFDTSIEYELFKYGKPISQLNSKERSKSQRLSENRILMGADIIACTLSSCYTQQMESIFGGHKDRISVCIVDEATQSCEAETLIPLMLGVNTLVLVGDPNQLPATILSQRAKKLGLDQSIFSRMQNIFGSKSNSPIIMLDTQYRMEYAISYWPNNYFYQGKLKNATDYRATFPFHSYRVLHHTFKQNDDKFTNTTEAEFVANMIFAMFMFVKWEETDSTISLGVLTPYNNQKTLVQKKINDKVSSVPDSIKKRINIEVNTVDGFQGQERDIIIMSCVRSSGIGFMSDKQRLCVALTRAKHSLILCGNFNTFMDPMWKALLADARGRGIFCNVDANASPAIIRKFVVRRKNYS